MTEAQEAAGENWTVWGEQYRAGLFIIQPPPEVCSPVNILREQYDPVSRSRIGAHITITQPLMGDLIENQWDRLDKTTAGFEPVTIHSERLKKFLPNPCIWHDIQPADYLLAIRKALHQTGFFNLAGGYIEDFIPHMTITEGESGPEVTLDSLNELQQECQSGSFSCQEPVLAVPDRDFQFFASQEGPAGSFTAPCLNGRGCAI